VPPPAPSEEAALNAAACELLEGLAPDLLAAQLPRMRERLAPPAGAPRATPVASPRVKVLLPQQRPVDAKRFRTVIGALCATRRLKVRYRCRSRSGETEHVISPQRVIFHRSNWYLAAWCHAANELRVFSVDRIEFAEALDEAADVIDTARLEATLDGGYGIGSGEARAMAVLRFTPAAARWVAEEQWHPLQRVDRLGDGSVTLHVPYGDPSELRGEILRWGPEVEVVSPPELRAELSATLERAAALYG
jgi:predicted DNA-binding transcriptional regulator YafY